MLLSYIIRRVLLMVPTALGVVTAVFLIIHLIPGDPVQVMLGDEASQTTVIRLREQLGLDQPLHIQFIRYVRGLFSGNLGQSISTRQPVSTMIWGVALYTVELATAAMIIGLGLGIPLGIIQAVRRNTIADMVTSVFSVVWYSAPGFWIGFLFIYFFCLKLGWFPVIADGSRATLLVILKQLTLPALTIGLRRTALAARMMRSTVLEVLGQDYIRTARAKGLSERIVTYKHAMRNALIPVITISGVEWGSLLGGAVIAEVVFVRPGIGRMMVSAIFSRDYPVVQGGLLIVGAMFMIVNLLVDISYAFVDPRIRYS